MALTKLCNVTYYATTPPQKEFTKKDKNLLAHDGNEMQSKNFRIREKRSLTIKKNNFINEKSFKVNQNSAYLHVHITLWGNANHID